MVYCIALVNINMAYMYGIHTCWRYEVLWDRVYGIINPLWDSRSQVSLLRRASFDA